MKSGIYSILNLVNLRHYVGSAEDFDTRWKAHLSLLGRGKHHSRILQNAWNKYGEENFRFEVIEEAEIKDLMAREQFYMDQTRPYYNVLRVAGRVTGYRHTDESKEVMRQKKLGLKLPEEQRAKISTANKGRKWTGPQREKLMGRPKSDLEKARLSAAHMGKKHTSEHIEKAAAARRGTKFSEESKEKLRAAKANMSDESKRAICDGLVKAHAKNYIATSPDGAIYEVFNLSEFSRAHGLGDGCGLNRVALGYRKQYKGWSCRQDKIRDIFRNAMGVEA